MLAVVLNFCYNTSREEDNFYIYVMRTSIAVLLIIVALVVGGVGGYYLAQQIRPEASAPVAETAAPVVNPFEAQQVNPLEGAGYQNPLEEVKFNPFE